MTKTASSILSLLRSVAAVALLLLLALAAMAVGRMGYYAENTATFSSLFSGVSVTKFLAGCLRFDVSAVMYLNALAVALLLLLPLRWQKATLWLFVTLNAAGLAMNLADGVYFKYTGHRTTMSVFSEFSHDGNLMKVFGAETISHWYLFLLFFVAAAGLFWAARRVVRQYVAAGPSVIGRIIVLLAFVPLCIFGMRGGIGRAVRPITVSNANQYVSRPADAALVLNTPFSMFRTVGKSVFRNPGYFSDSELHAIYSPLHTAAERGDTAAVRRKNIVILIVESLGREYVGALNETLEGGRYKGYTPFLDSLSRVALTFDYTFANGRKSIDAMPSVLSGIPQFVEPFFLTPSAMNRVGGIARSLTAEGYTTAFFHGAANGSMGFEAFARASGYGAYYGRTEYDADSRFGGEKDFDGTWAIWDEEFLQYFALTMNTLREPFVSSVFTASSHHPYVVPERYRGVYADDERRGVKGLVRETNPMHKCVRYADMSLRRFFETASRQPWFRNTIFVITGDHTNIYDHDVYGTDLGLFSTTIMFYDPSGEMPRGRSHVIAQQTDIMPTVMAWVGSRQPYVAWGKNLLDTKPADSWAVNYNNGLYQYVTPRYLIQHDGTALRAVYDYRRDPLLHRNLVTSPSVARSVAPDVRRLKAIIQTYMERMTTDRLTAE